MDNLQDLIKLGKELTVLYVEDDIRLQQETAKMLARVFHKVVVANDGQEAILQFESEPCDLIITDLEMPVMNGLGMAEYIKKNHPDIPIIVISAYTDTDYFLDAIEIGVDLYVVKPVNTQKFLSTIYRACKQLEDKRIADNFKMQEIEGQLENERQRMLSEVSNSSPNPMAVFCDNKLKYCNHAFQEKVLFDQVEANISSEEKFIAYINGNIGGDTLILKDEHLITPLKVEDNSFSSRQIAIKVDGRSRIYELIKSPIEIEGQTDSFIYTFNDITEIMYQKLQLDSYGKQIDSLIQDNFMCKDEKNAQEIIDKTAF